MPMIKSLYKYFTNITKQIWWPHWKYSPHSQHAKWASKPNSFAYLCQTQLTGPYTSHAVAKYVAETNAPTKFGTCLLCQTFDMHIWGVYVHIFTTYEACAL